MIYNFELVIHINYIKKFLKKFLKFNPINHLPYGFRNRLTCFIPINIQFSPYILETDLP